MKEDESDEISGPAQLFQEGKEAPVNNNTYRLSGSL